MNLDQARFNMIEQQIRTWQVLAPETIDCLFAVKRERFAPFRYRNLAFAETEIPLGHGACMLSPGVEARMINALQLKPTDRVLEIGTGSGYMAALLAVQAQHVDTIEIVTELAASASASLGKACINNVRAMVGDGLDPASIHGTYDVIVLSGSLPLVPHHLIARLKIGGRMVAIVGDEVNMEVQLMKHESETSYIAAPLFETVAPALKSAGQHKKVHVIGMEQISASQLKAWLDDAAGLKPLLLDVREPGEFAHCHIEGAQSMPMGNVPARIQELDSEVPTVVICHHGMRSLQVAMYLQQQGFGKLYNLSGGVAAWAAQVDTTMPTY